MLKKLKPYLISVLIAIGVGLLASFLTKDSMDIYTMINKPSLSPPAGLFPVVWTILYILMGISSAMVYNKGGAGTEKALGVYASQLILNFLWSIVFFNLRSFTVAFIILIALWILIAVMIYKFSKIRPVAAYLQIPYLLWVTFAGYLNLMIVMLN